MLVVSGYESPDENWGYFGIAVKFLEIIKQSDIALQVYLVVNPQAQFGLIFEKEFTV